jgi:hypothetical protein
MDRIGRDVFDSQPAQGTRAGARGRADQDLKVRYVRWIPFVAASPFLVNRKGSQAMDRRTSVEHEELKARTGR